MAETIRTIVLDANVLAAAAVALAAGLVSFASPCVLPHLLGWLSRLTRQAEESLTRTGRRDEPRNPKGRSARSRIAPRALLPGVELPV